MVNMKKKLTVILDAGHGKETPGKRSPKLKDNRQLLEWQFNRERRVFSTNSAKNDWTCKKINLDTVFM